MGSLSSATLRLEQTWRDGARVTQRAIYWAAKSLLTLFAVISDLHIESLLVSLPAWLLWAWNSTDMDRLREA